MEDEPMSEEDKDQILDIIMKATNKYFVEKGMDALPREWYELALKFIDLRGKFLKSHISEEDKEFAWSYLTDLIFGRLYFEQKQSLLKDLEKEIHKQEKLYI